MKRWFLGILLAAASLFVAPSVTEAYGPCPGTQQVVYAYQQTGYGSFNVFTNGGTVGVGVHAFIGNIKYIHVAFTAAGSINYTVNQANWGVVYYTGRGYVAAPSYACIG